jgi:alginate O-acetyltransferase complex protein AlgI
MIILIPISWTIFNITDITQLGEYFLRMFGIPLEGMVVFGFSKLKELLYTYWWLILVCIFFCTPYPLRFFRKYRRNILVKILLLAIFWYSVYQSAISGDNPFIYFNF